MQAGEFEPVCILLCAGWRQRRRIGYDEENRCGLRQISVLWVTTVSAYLTKKGSLVGRHRVRRLMAKMGLEAIYKRPNTSKAHPQHPIYPYLLRKMNIDRPNQVWCSNITVIPVKHGFLYLVAIIDWATRKVLSWRLSNTMHADFCVEALTEALDKYGPPEIMNTDQGSQFTGSA